MSGTSGKAISQLSTAQSISGSDIIPITQNVAGNLITNGASASQMITYTSNPVIPVSVNTAGVPASTVYHETVASMTFQDNLQSVAVNPSGSILFQTTAVAGYIRNQNPNNAGVQNAVALFGLGVCEVDNAYTWGINTLAADTSTPGSGSGTGRLIQNEFDYNISYSTTTVNGLVLAGIWYAQPAASNGFVVLAPGSHGGPYRWNGAFLTGDNAANNALAVGLLGAVGTASTPSQPIILGNTDGSGTRHELKLQATTGNVFAITGDTPAALDVQGGITAGGTSSFVTPAQLDSSTQPATTAWVNSAGPTIGGQTIVSSTTALTNAVVGQFIPITTTGITVTLPQASTIPNGRGFVMRNEAAGIVGLAPHSGDTLTITGLNSSECAWFASNGVNGWYPLINTLGSPKTSVTGSRGGNAALASLITALAAMGLVVDNTTA